MAFQEAWNSIIKMPMYHGTYQDNLESIMSEGLRPTDIAPELLGDTGSMKSKLQEKYGDDYEDLFGGLWSFYWGPNSERTREKIGGLPQAIYNAANWSDAPMSNDESWRDEEAQGIVLEIDNEHPDAPKFLSEPEGWDRSHDQHRSNQIIPPHLIRQVPQQEIFDALRQLEDYQNMNLRMESWMTELVDKIASGETAATDKEFDQALQLRTRSFRTPHSGETAWWKGGSFE